MSTNKLFLLLLSSPFLMAVVLCPVLSENENSAGDEPIELIPLNASYDTARKIGADSGTNVVSIPQASVINPPTSGADNNQLAPEGINMRRIVPIVFEGCLNSRSVWLGDQVTARLKEDLYCGRDLIARKNSLLKGRVISYRAARTLSETILHREDRLKSGSAVGIQFDQLIIEQGKSITLTGLPVHQESFRLGADGYTYGIAVDSQGRIIQAGRILTKEQKDSVNILRVATIAPTPGNLLVGVVAAPVVMGVVGAASPDIAFNKPIDRNVKHRRLKGMAYGFVTNLPGAFFVQATVEKGNEIFLNNGDELMIDLAINNAHPAASNNSQPVANTTTEVLAVQGQVLKTERANPAPTPYKKTRLLPASSLPDLNNANELALKPFIPSSD